MRNERALDWLKSDLQEVAEDRPAQHTIEEYLARLNLMGTRDGRNLAQRFGGDGLIAQVRTQFGALKAMAMIEALAKKYSTLGELNPEEAGMVQILVAIASQQLLQEDKMCPGAASLLDDFRMADASLFSEEVKLIADIGRLQELFPNASSDVLRKYRSSLAMRHQAALKKQFGVAKNSILDARVVGRVTELDGRLVPKELVGVAEQTLYLSSGQKIEQIYVEVVDPKTFKLKISALQYPQRFES